MGGNKRESLHYILIPVSGGSSSYCDAFSVLTPQEFLNLFVTAHQLLGNPPIKIVYNTWAELDGFRCKWGMSEPHEIGRNSKGSEISPPPEICNACHITSMGSLIGCVWRKLQLIQCIFKIKIDWLPSSCLHSRELSLLLLSLSGDYCWKYQAPIKPDCFEIGHKWLYQ